MSPALIHTSNNIIVWYNPADHHHYGHIYEKYVHSRHTIPLPPGHPNINEAPASCRRLICALLQPIWLFHNACGSLPASSARAGWLVQEASNHNTHVAPSIGCVCDVMHPAYGMRLYASALYCMPCTPNQPV
jgi:hypothetical protein